MATNVTSSGIKNSDSVGENITLNPDGSVTFLSAPDFGSTSFVKVAGDTMTGQLTLPGGGGNTEALQKQEIEALIDAADKYVEVAGDNMTGDLTLGTDKITLNATDGSAEFAGRISGNGECFLGDNNSDPRGYLKIVNNSTNDDDDAIRITDTANNNVAKVRVDGSAEFSGRVLCGTSINPNIGTGSWLQDNGGIYTTRPAGSSDAAFTVYQQGGADSPTVEINADGSASFAGGIQSGDAGGGSSNTGTFVYSTRYINDANHGSAALNATSNDNDLASLYVIDRSSGNETVIIKPDGTAEFAGRVSGSRLDVNNSTTNPDDIVFSVNTGEPAATVQRFKADGTMQIGDVDGGTDTANITLNQDGSAEFADAVLVGTDPRNGTNTGTRLGTTTGLTATGDTGAQYVVSLYNRGVSERTTGIQANGSASFAGQVTSGADPSGGTSTGAILNQTGVVKAGRAADNDVVWQGFHVGESLATSTITASGSATFDSTVKQGDFNGGRTDTTGSVLLDAGGIATQYAASTTASDSRALRVYHGNSENVTVFADGSVTFVADPGTQGTTAGNRISSTGLISVAREDDGPVFRGNKTDSGGYNVTLNADGSAEFAGSVLSGGPKVDGTDLGSFIGQEGNSGFTCGASSSAIRIWTQGNTTPTVNIKGNGSAEYAGDITANNVTFNLEPDNDANYVSTTDSEGVETRVYNGPTLDVKDRLTKTQDALTALKTAAQDNATDLAGLKAAIVAALANI